MIFTGYLARTVPSNSTIQKTRKEQGLENGQKLVVVTTGGGGDGYEVMDHYLSMLESLPQPADFKSVLVTGPFMPKEQRKNLFRRAKRMRVRTFHFYRNMEKLLAGADLVVGMGGYNTLCEILSMRIPSLIIPRESPRREQLIRARIFREQHLLDYIPWYRCTPQVMGEKVAALLSDASDYREAIARFPMNGIVEMRKRLAIFSGTDSADHDLSPRLRVVS
jgi:predicted glycosyltransferase